MGKELFRRSSSMLPSYHRASSAGVELEPLTGGRLSASEGANGNINGPTKNDDVTIAIESSPPSYYNDIRDLLVSLCFFILGWWGPKYMLPSEEFLQNRQIPYQVLSNNDTVIDLSLNNPLVQPPTVPCKCIGVRGLFFVG